MAYDTPSQYFLSFSLAAFWQRISMLIHNGCQKHAFILLSFTRFHTITQRNNSTFLCYILLKINL